MFVVAKINILRLSFRSLGQQNDTIPPLPAHNLPRHLYMLARRKAQDLGIVEVGGDYKNNDWNCNYWDYDIVLMWRRQIKRNQSGLKWCLPGKKKKRIGMWRSSAKERVWILIAISEPFAGSRCFVTPYVIIQLLIWDLPRQQDYYSIRFRSGEMMVEHRIRGSINFFHSWHIYLTLVVLECLGTEAVQPQHISHYSLKKIFFHTSVLVS